MSIRRVTEQDIRLLLLSDVKEKNTLYDGVRFSSEQIDRACEFTVDQFNSIPPPTVNYTVESFPYRMLLLKGCAGLLIKSQGVGDLSNNLQYNAESIAVNDRGNGPALFEMGNSLWAEFLNDAKQIKITQNISNFFGSRSSEYGWHWNTI